MMLRNISFTPVSAKIRAINSIRCVAALTKAFTPVAVVCDFCITFGSAPIWDREIPVRASFSWSIFSNMERPSFKKLGVAKGVTAPGPFTRTMPPGRDVIKSSKFTCPSMTTFLALFCKYMLSIVCRRTVDLISCKSMTKSATLIPKNK